jgi:GNAT superfamily N-acetyltransferase
MDGSTWRNYRAVVDAGDRPPFFLEPQNPPEWIRYFVAGGFDAIANYFSAETTDLGIRRPQLKRPGNRLAAQDISVEALQPQCLDEPLGEIYSIVTSTFRHNLFYSPLEKAQYLQQYRQLSRIVPLDFVLIARRREEPVGFVFALPDLLQQHRGEAIDTLIIKSIGVSPGFDNAGIGQLLLTSVGERAAERGYRRIIHALMRDIPRLRRLSSRDAFPIRRYALFAKVLGK